MTLRNEIMDAVTVYKALDDPKDKYYEEMVEEARRRNRQNREVDRSRDEAIKRRRAQIAAGNAPTPLASASTPGSAPPVASDRRVWDEKPDPGPTIPIGDTQTAFRPVEPFQFARRGGLIKKFERGGSATREPPEPEVKDYTERPDPTDPGGEVDPSDPDGIVRDLMRGNPTAASRINASIEEPWPVTGPGSEWQSEGTRERLAQEKKTREAQALDTQSFQQQPEVTKRSRLGRIVDALGGDPFAQGEAEARRRIRRQRRANEPGLTEELSDVELRQREAEDERLRKEFSESVSRGTPDLLPKGGIELGVPKVPGFNAPFTEQQRAAAAEAEAAKSAAPPAVPGGPVSPGGEPIPTALPQAPQGAIPGQSVVRVQGTKRDKPLGEPQPAAGPPTPVTPAAPPAPVVAGPGNVPVPGSNNGPATPATPAQGGGQGTVQAPPPAAATTATPTPAPKPTQTAANVPAAAPATPAAPAATAPGPGGTRVTPGSLGDQNRTGAFRPDLPSDANDPRNVQAVDAAGARQGMPTAQQTQEMARSVQGVAQGYANKHGQIPLGDGAVSRQTYQGVVQAHRRGDLTEGEALMVGMHAMYRTLLSQGRAKEAATMAWGLMQAANLEAASEGRVAQDMIRRGDLRGATQRIVSGLEKAPDNMRHEVGPDGQSIVTKDASGRVIGTTRVDGKNALAMALGLSDGSLLWEALQASWQSQQPPDKDAQGRQLRNELTRRNIELADLRIKKGMQPPGAKAPKGQMSDTARAGMAIYGQSQPPPGQVTVINQGGGDGLDQLPNPDPGDQP